MIPILYPSTQTEFNNNGIGCLTDAVSCLVHPGLNDQYELALRYPVKGKHFLQLAMRSVILAKVDPVSALQPFRIYKISKPSSGIVTVNARHIAYDQAGITVAPFVAQTAPEALAGLKSHAVTENPFSYSTDKTTAAAFTVAVPAATWSLLGGSKGSILDVYGGEYEYDRYQVKLLTRRGADRGVSIRYGKNLTSLQQDENCANCYTGVVPFWQSKSSGTVITLPEKVVAADGNFDYTKTLPLDVTSMITLEETEDGAESLPTEDQIRTAARKYMTDNKIGVPTVSWTVQFVQLEQTEEYKGKALLERVLLGDTVSVEFPELNVSASARAVACVYNSLLERYESITLGSVRSSLVDTIVGQGQAISDQNDKIDAIPGMSQIKADLNQLTAILLGATGGTVRLLDTDGDGLQDTLYIADDPDPAAAVKVWRFNYEGWGASKTGYNGPFEMGATFDSGILADFIRAGTLDADLVKVINLIAERLVAKSDVWELAIVAQNGVLHLEQLGKVLAKMTAEIAGQAYIELDSYAYEFGDGDDPVLGDLQHRATYTPFGMAVQDYRQIPPTDLFSVNTDPDTGISTMKVSAVNPGKKVLFSGDVEMGNTLEVPDTALYDLFVVLLGNSDSILPGVVFVYKHGDTLYGAGGWGGSTEYYKDAMYFTATFVENTWSYIYGSKHSITMSGTWHSGTKLHIREIIGII